MPQKEEWQILPRDVNIIGDTGLTVENHDIAELGLDFLGLEDKARVGGLVCADLDGDAVCRDDRDRGSELAQSTRVSE